MEAVPHEIDQLPPSSLTLACPFRFPPITAQMAPKKHLWGTKDDADTAYVCFGCHDEVFNQLFVESGTTNKESHEPFCFKCAAKTQKKGGDMSCLSFRSLEELEKALEAFNVYADDLF